MLATRDAVFASRTSSLAGYSVTSDNDVSYRVIGPAGPDAVFVQSPRTGILAVAIRTGKANVRGRGEQVRVRIHFASDTGDAYGTLDFADPHVGGVAPRVLFA